MKKALFILLIIASWILSTQAVGLQEQTIISGRVIHAADQEPVEGAAVELYLHTQFTGTVPARPSFEEPYEKAVTDPNGFFRFELNQRELGPSLGPVLLITRKKGLAAGIEKVSGSIFSSPQNEPIVISLKAPGSLISLEGKVTDTEGHEIAQAQVYVSRCDRQNIDFDLGHINAISIYTDSAGSFKLEGIPPSRSIQIAVSKPGMGRSFQEVWDLDINKKTNPMKITLQPAANLKGILIDKAAGKPITFTGLTLNALRTGNVYYSCRTDKQGNFFFEDIEPGKYSLQCLHSLSGHSGLSRQIIMEAGKTAEITYEISEGGTVVFLVLDSVHENPLRGVEIHFASSAQGDNMCTTEVNGRARWNDRPPGEYVIQEVYKHGYRIDYSMNKPFIIESGKTTSLEFFLSPSPRFKGIVLDTEQKPLPETEVMLFARQSIRFFNTYVTRTVITDSEGKFDIPWDAADKTPVPDYVFARCARRNLAILQPVTTSLDELCRVQMQKGVVIAGQVENAQGQPLANVLVGVDTYFTIDQQDIPLVVNEVFSDPNGMFEVPAIPRNCSIRVLVRHDLYNISPLARKVAPLEEDRIVLEPFVLKKGE